MGKVVMAIMAHPDDAELSCSGTLLRWKAEGAHIVIVDLTAGQLGSRGKASLRYEESCRAARAMGLLARVNMGWEDGFFSDDPTRLHALIDVIRQYQPNIIITNALSDRHPDHARAAHLVERAAFLSGLRQITSHYPSYRPLHVLFSIQDRWQTPSLVVDITPFWEEKLRIIQLYKSQFFYHPTDEDPPTYLTRATFFPHLEARAREMGHFIGVPYGEGFVVRSPLAAPPLAWMTRPLECY
ncbi:MAG: bacillithiol biosynthesis deacetylase BshB1 [Bacteroidia bacterium]|nr:bacillithiol biosynthesis deacetylase BshB1 [Bacteroidia bacterium]MDW8133576.1 bacillithiol biosynthesis deacetylase BshB1 [Bacteroidia bacterium]